MRPEKKQLVEDIGRLLEPSPYIVLVTYKGLDVDEFEGLRQSLAEVGAECHVVPNRLLKRALNESQFEPVSRDTIVGDTAMVTGGDDAVAVAKVLRDFAKDHEALQVKIGAIGGQLLSSADVGKLAALPSREVLLAQLLGVIQAPSRNLVGVLHAKLAGVVYALKAYLDKKQGTNA